MKSSEATLIFPHQLFEDHPAIEQGRAIFLIEDAHFFTRYRFHKQKLVFHKATMTEYARYLEKKGYKPTLITLDENYREVLRKHKITHVHCARLYDFVLEENVQKQMADEGIRFLEYDSPYFMTSQARFEEHFSKKDSFYFTSFYKEQRHYFNILMTEEKRPVGGTLSFDPENRKKLPANVRVPLRPITQPSASIEEAQTWVARFADHPGFVDSFIYPVTHDDAKAWLEEFLAHRLQNFGPYQDALTDDQSMLFHSILSPLINVGLLTPAYVVERTLLYADSHEVPLNSLEGFIRQIIGWREFVYGVYLYKGRELQQSNFFNHHNKLPSSFWSGTTGIEPIDGAIERLLKTGYAHHIERLMLFGNFILLSGIDPDDAYLWFMEMYIDSYDWVMIPNVYGMSQFAGGTLMTTKPYISGANYLKKMSSYPPGIWEKLFTDLYWRFMVIHEPLLVANNRMKPLFSMMHKRPRHLLAQHVHDGSLFLKHFFGKTNE